MPTLSQPSRRLQTTPDDITADSLDGSFSSSDPVIPADTLLCTLPIEYAQEYAHPPVSISPSLWPDPCCVMWKHKAAVARPWDEAQNSTSSHHNRVQTVVSTSLHETLYSLASSLAFLCCLGLFLASLLLLLVIVEVSCEVVVESRRVFWRGSCSTSLFPTLSPSSLLPPQARTTTVSRFGLLDRNRVSIWIVLAFVTAYWSRETASHVFWRFWSVATRMASSSHLSTAAAAAASGHDSDDR